MMRKRRVIDALFPATRQEILETLVLQSDRSWYLSDLAAHLGRRNPSSLQRELESLVAAEILIRREEGNRVYFQANRECPVFAELVGLFAKTAGLAEVICRSLDRLRDRISIAFIHGSIARHEERAASDVDLLVVGEIGLADLAVGLRKAESELSRAINASVYRPAEFDAKVKAGHHFLNAILGREKIFLIGNEHELAELLASGSGAAARHEQAGTR